jgi:butyryl-CoA dehydrogenase
MDYTLTPHQEDLRKRARALADTIEQFEDECEKNNGLSAKSHAVIHQAVLDSGLQGINTPVADGGSGLDLFDQYIVQEQLGRLTNALWDTVWRPANPLAHATPEQRERYLVPDAKGDRRDAVAISERTAGSDFRSASTSATPDGKGGYLLNGEKWFVTVGDVADFLIVLAYVEPDHSPTLFLVDKDTPGITISRVPRWTHTFVYEHPEFVFKDVAVGADAILGGIGQGDILTQDWFTEERLMIGARTIGAAERALELAADWARERVQGGDYIINHQMIQQMLAECAADIAANRALGYQVAWEFTHPDTTNPDERKSLHAKASTVKLSAARASNRVLDKCQQIFGGRGYDRTYPVERLWRELRVDRIWEGTDEIQEIIVANEIKKRGTRRLLSIAGQDPVG